MALKKPYTLDEQIKKLILVGEIVNVSADDSVITDGKVDMKKLKPIAFDPFNNAYVGMGEKVGNAFSDGQKLR